MKTLKKLITRVNVTIVLLIAQVFLFLFLFELIIYHFPRVTLLIYLVSILIILSLIKKDKDSAYKATWIIVVMGVPILGAILYLMFKNNRPLKWVRARMQKEQDVAIRYLEENAGLIGENAAYSDRAKGLLQYIQNASSYPPYKNTETKYYPLGELMFEDMLTELSKAEKFIFMEYFIIYESKMWDQILEILIRKAGEGVDVRLIFDDLGTLKLFTKSYVSGLNSKKIKTVRFSPIVPFASLFMNNRDHRKIMIIDGHTGFNGGINISDEYINLDQRFGIWKDTGVKLSGDAVWSFTVMFLESWNVFCKPEERVSDYSLYKNTATVSFADDGLVVPYGDSPLYSERLGENIYIDILNKAKHYVYIFTPYLIITEKMVFALQMAAKRGVDVRLVTPGIPDKKIILRITRSYYRSLLNAGVKIYEYSPGFLHAKSFVCDDEVAVVGTINLDYRSLYLHFECATLLCNSNAVKDIKEDAIQTIAEGREILPNNEKKFWNELFDAILHLFAPLL